MGDAHLQYLSRSTGKVKEVVVEMVNHAKCEVEITFAENSSVWKVIPFSTIASETVNPLLGPWKGPITQESETDDIIKRLQGASSGSTAEPEARARSRSRSPKSKAEAT